MKLRTFIIAASSFCLTAIAAAKNVDLSTIPPRDTVQLTIYNSEDLTLVRETRHLTFKAGVNPLQFSWANTLIDPTSVELRFKTGGDRMELLDTTFPHDKREMLYWNVRSERDGDAVVEITYFTSGISWSADYVCVSDPAEESMTFNGFVRIVNNSGEDYENAQVRLVVGTINLVEQVAELARRGVISVEEKDEYFAGRKKAIDFCPKARAPLRSAVAGQLADAEAAQPKEIVKEGLSEYFIYTIEGTETVRHTWSKRMRSFQGEGVPFKVRYRYRPAEYGNQLVRLFLLCNDEESKLGSTPLPNGVLRLFRDNGHDGLSYVMQRTIEYVPVGQEIVLNLGPDPQVIHELVRLRGWRDGFWFLRHTPHLYFSPTEGHRVEANDNVAGWDDHAQWVERIRNYRDEAIDVEIRRTFQGHVFFRSELGPILYDYRSPQFNAAVKPGEKRDLAYHLITRQGYNKKQDHVVLEQGN